MIGDVVPAYAALAPAPARAGPRRGDGPVFEYDPPRRLVHEWRSLYDPDMASEQPSRVTCTAVSRSTARWRRSPSATADGDRRHKAKGPYLALLKVPGPMTRAGKTSTTPHRILGGPAHLRRRPRDAVPRRRSVLGIQVANQYKLGIGGENPGYGIPASLNAHYTDTSANGMMAAALRQVRTCGFKVFVMLRLQ